MNAIADENLEPNSTDGETNPVEASPESLEAPGNMSPMDGDMPAAKAAYEASLNYGRSPVRLGQLRRIAERMKKSDGGDPSDDGGDKNGGK